MTYYTVERKDDKGKTVETRLIEAPSAKSAILHVATPYTEAKKPSPKELVGLLLQGSKPETVEVQKRPGRPKLKKVA